ncbi:MAG: cytochrome P450 [Microthrixaceae bacterium]
MLDVAAADELLVAVITTDEGRQDPYSIYAQLRAESPRWTSGVGSTVLATYRDSMEVLRNPKLGRVEPDMPQQASISGNSRPQREDTSVMLFLNPPDHTRIRGLVSRAFTPKRVEKLRPRLEAMLTPILDDLALDGGGDVMETLAVPFPVAVISELLGVPPTESDEIAPYVHDAARLIDAAADDEVIARGEAATERLGEYFVELAQRKQSAPDDGLFSALIQVESEGDRLSEEELIANTILLYAAGFETTSNLIGNGLRLLLANPDELSRLRATPSLMGSAIWEMLRHDSPVQLNVRAVLEETDVLGGTVPRGTSYIVLQGSGNHDESVYEDPSRFDIARFDESRPEGPAPTPLSFGWGAHHCLGAHLARAEGEIVFSGLLERFADIELDTTALPKPPPAPAGPNDLLPELRYRPSFTLRGLDALPVAVSAG